jgi:uncharacterized phage-associated protein
MPYNAAAVANTFLELAKRDHNPLTNMQLQKLVYIAHGWNLALASRPLFYNEIQAWEWGPVIPSLYNSLKKYGAGIVNGKLPKGTPPVDPFSTEMRIIEGVWRAYGNLSAMKLSGITHAEGTPWSETWAGGPYGVITDEKIERHYRQLLNERTKAKFQPA